MDKFIGKWKRVSVENPKAMLDILGVPEEMQQALIESPSTTILEKVSDTEWKETEQIGDYKQTSTMILGKETQETDETGAKYTSFLEWDGSKIVGYMDFTGKGLRADVFRKVEGDTQTMSMTVGDQTSIQIYKRV